MRLRRVVLACSQVRPGEPVLKVFDVKIGPIRELVMLHQRTGSDTVAPIPRENLPGSFGHDEPTVELELPGRIR